MPSWREARRLLRRRWRVLAIFAAAATALWVAVALKDLPSPAELSRLKAGPVHETALMRQRKAQAKKGWRASQRWVDLAAISPDAVAAVIASEDARFFEHGGLDLKQLRTAVEEHVADGRRMRGASTITQQVAKNLFLSEDRSLSRKLKEVVIAWRLERTLSKRRILALYLNVAEWGEGLFGIEAAARAYRGKSAAELSLAEGAALAAMLPSPKRYTPANRAVLLARGQHVLERVAQEHLATDVQLALARVELDSWLGNRPIPAAAEAAPADEEAESEEEAQLAAEQADPEPTASEPSAAPQPPLSAP